MAKLICCYHSGNIKNHLWSKKTAEKKKIYNNDHIGEWKKEIEKEELKNDWMI